MGGEGRVRRVIRRLLIRRTAIRILICLVLSLVIRHGDGGWSLKVYVIFGEEEGFKRCDELFSDDDLAGWLSEME